MDQPQRSDRHHRPRLTMGKHHLLPPSPSVAGRPSAAKLRPIGDITASEEKRGIPSDNAQSVRNEGRQRPRRLPDGHAIRENDHARADGRGLLVVPPPRPGWGPDKGAHFLLAKQSACPP